MSKNKMLSNLLDTVKNLFVVSLNKIIDNGGKSSESMYLELMDKRNKYLQSLKDKGECRETHLLRIKWLEAKLILHETYGINV